MDYSLPAWLGALAGMIVAVAVYVPAIHVIERHLREGNRAATADERSAFEDRLSVVRRTILGVEVAIGAVLGYWIGNAIGGAGVAAPLH